MEDFLIKGVTTAVLNNAGTVPFLRDVLHRAVRNGDRRSLHSLSSHIGSGSNQDCLFGASWISFETSAGMTGSNDERVTLVYSQHWHRDTWVMEQIVSCYLRTFSVLDVKKSREILWWECWWIRRFAPSEDHIERLPETSGVGEVRCLWSPEPPTLLLNEAMWCLERM